MNTIHHIAKLAKLKLSDQEAMEFSNEFEGILSHFSNIDQEDLTGIEMEDYGAEQSVVRKDESKLYKNKKELFQNAKEKKDNSIVIPKVMD